jgi:hypothetical protein
MKIANKLLMGILSGLILSGCNFGGWMGWNEMPQGQYYVTISNVQETGGLLGGCDDILTVSANTVAQVNNNGNIRIGGSQYSQAQVNLDNNPCFEQSDNLFGTDNNIKFSNCKAGTGNIGEYQMNANLTMTDSETESAICTADIQFTQINNV